MIRKDVDITIPLLWGNDHFIKAQWGSINYLIATKMRYLV